MDTDVVEHSGAGTTPGGAAVMASDVVGETPEATIDEVDHLLTRLDEGTYGTCSACGTAIDDARLAGDPTVLTCGGCDAEDPLPAHGDAAVAGVVRFSDGRADVETDDGPVAVAGATPGDVEETSDADSRPEAEREPSWD